MTTRRPDPELRDIEKIVDTVQGREVVRGTLLGKSSSRRRTHSHERDRLASVGERCSACRWMEVFILYDTQAEQYVAITEGRSAVEGEIQRGHVERTTSALWVVQCLYQPARNGRPKQLSYTSQRAIASAARYDADIADAYAADAANVRPVVG